ncbi:GPW/gp25 family protein [Methylobacterium aquaticum]|uniref:GPW/gp25 family protein n=1 Tax=Methylobacterium aquaticum TaxID=270351 RepID=UPI0019332282|nr:GPW/gp25 family protein [Methylobacterium aquaticum]QRE74382.1 integrase [Methylobacterium aquaticum]
MLALRYRQGIDARTGRPLAGAAHLAQSIEMIWATRLGELVMLLEFGANLRSHLAEDVTGALALEIYDDLTGAVERWEPEYRLREMQLVSLTRDGGLGLRHSGLYYPEGRLGNYAVSVPFGATSGLSRYEAVARRATARDA